MSSSRFLPRSNVSMLYVAPTPRVQNLRDVSKKMSKSDENDLNRINLTDTKDDIQKKIRKAKTDSLEGVNKFDIDHL